MLAGWVAVIQRVAMHHDHSPFMAARSTERQQRAAQPAVEAGDAARQQRGGSDDHDDASGDGDVPRRLVSGRCCRRGRR